MIVRRALALLLICYGLVTCIGCRRGKSAPAQASPGAAMDAQTAVASAQAKLLKVQAKPSDSAVPVEAQNGIGDLKDALAAMTDGALAAMPASAAAAEVQGRLTSMLPPKRPEPQQHAPVSKEDFDKPEAGDFGNELSAAVSKPQPGLLLVQESFEIECGADNVLLVYSNASGAWKRIARWQAPRYGQISGAFGDWYEARILTPQRNGHPVLLVVHGTPWCTSTESEFKVDALELEPGKETSSAFFHATHQYRRADEENVLKLTPDGFEIRASVDDWDGDVIARKGVMRYRMSADKLERVLPIAMNARESVDEWIRDMHRTEAARFTDAPPESLLWKMWQTLSYDGKPQGADVPSTSYGAVRACTDSAKHYQVEIDTETYTSGDKPIQERTLPGTQYYVQLEETGNGYLLHSARTTPDPGCNGRVVQAP